jgi:hypothetical protein
MNRTLRRLSAKRVATKTSSERPVAHAGDDGAAGNYINFVLGVVLVIGIYLIAGAFGI